uniref:Immunoglobulin V-set domain-containing protein n=1 Tax=Oryzias latipes TaxID=8090 RepID=A0A3B3HMQ2_ORYLA
MDQRWMKILLTLVFYLQVTTCADRTLQEGSTVHFKCQIPEGTVVFWFRLLDGSNMEFIASFSNTGMEKKFEQQFKNLFSHEKKDTYFILTLKSFSASRDSGAYVCAALVKGNMLQFGEIERVHGEKKRETTKAPSMIFTHPPTTVSTRASTRSCACSHMPAAGVRIHHHFLLIILRKKTDRKYIFLFLFAEKTKPLLPCDPLILGSLAGGCGLLLLLLIIITLYCNRTFRNHNILHTLERFKQSYM